MRVYSVHSHKVLKKKVCLFYLLIIYIRFFYKLKTYSFILACLVSYATETVMQICHGKRRCTLSADSNTFGKPCRPDSRMYLKVVYTCGKYCYFVKHIL